VSDRTSNPFGQWVRLEQPRLGTRVVYASDDFFAPKERLIDAADPVFIPDKYDDHGKWMDGWESRRKRVPGHDDCIVRLGIPGIVRGLDIDTSHFTGNYPPAASVDACVSQQDHPGEDAAWFELLPRVDLAGDAHNYLPVSCASAVTHLRLNIYPDGGVARLRIYGNVIRHAGEFEPGANCDLLAVENGGRALSSSDEHYGSMHNLNLPGGSTHMGDGWETARRRGPGNDWVIFALGCEGVLRSVEIDTAHYKGNFPDRAEIRAALNPGEDDIVAASENWPVLVAETGLRADDVHRFERELSDLGPVSHVRLNIFPDGGVARLRFYGRPVLPGLET
jgi:allantoicase